MHGGEARRGRGAGEHGVGALPAVLAALLLACAGCSGSTTGPRDGGATDATMDTGSHDAAKHDGGGCTTSATCAKKQACLGGQCCDPPLLDGGACSVFDACGCASSENCVRLMGGPEQCVPSGAAKEYGTCTLQTDCGRGLMCGPGVCQETCDPGPVPTRGACPVNTVCLAGAFGGVDLGYGGCAPHCNPVTPLLSDASHRPCQAGENCELLFDVEGDTYCRSPAGAFGQGEACASLDDCKTGFFCTECGETGCNAGFPHVCMQYCRVGFSDCPTGSCLSFMVRRFDGAQEIGLCSDGADAGGGG